MTGEGKMSIFCPKSREKGLTVTKSRIDSPKIGEKEPSTD